MSSITNRPDYSNLTPAMRSALRLLEAAWVDADEDGTPELAWVHGLKAGTVAALRRRGFNVVRRSWYHNGMECRMPDPHHSGLGW